MSSSRTSRTETHAFLVIPCFNESKRLRHEQIAALAKNTEMHVVWVDDFSSDTTAETLRARPYPHFHHLRLPRHMGRGEAVRAGLLFALDKGASTVGFTDADFAVSAEECLRLLRLHLHANAELTLGVRPLAHRSPVRRWMGRAFRASIGALALSEIADPQCPMKWFSSTPDFANACAHPFELSWTFDVELLGRLLRNQRRDVVQVELQQWQDRPGSRHSLTSMATSYGATLRYVLRHFRTRGDRE